MHRVSVLLVVLLLLAACASEPQPEPPEVTEMTEPEATATEILTPTPAPTLAQRSTLPPTWTPASPATVTPAPTTEQVVQPVVEQPVLPEACNTFEPDLERTPRNYVLGQDVTVYWSAVEGAGYYYVALTDEEAEIVFEDYTESTSYTFPADQFEAGSLYGWQAHPINALGIQMCLARGAELFPEF